MKVNSSDNLNSILANPEKFVMGSLVWNVNSQLQYESSLDELNVGIPKMWMFFLRNEIFEGR